MTGSRRYTFLLVALTISLPTLRAQFRFNHFAVLRVTDGAALQWNASNDTSTDHFDILRAGEDSVFVRIGRVTALHNGQSNNVYQFVDSHMLPGNNVYQLEYFGNNKATIFSTTDSLANIELTIKSLTVYPNPASSSVTLECDEWANMQVVFNMTDSKGRQISEQTITLDSQGKWIISNLPAPGYYLLKFTRDRVIYKQLLKVR
jgi:hypothetical protein